MICLQLKFDNHGPRSNDLFGRGVFNHDNVVCVLPLCHLIKTLFELSAGDLTDFGEKAEGLEVAAVVVGSA